MARRTRARRSTTSGVVADGAARGGGGGGAGSVRARLRLGAAALLGLLAALYLVLAVRLYFRPFGSVVASGVVAILLGVGALVYGLLIVAVVKKSRGGHILAAVVCLIGAVLSISVAMAWPDWAALVVNVVSAGLLLGCVPRRATPAS